MPEDTDSSPVLVPIICLRMVKPVEAEPGTLLVACAHYSYPPMFIFTNGEESFRFDLAPAALKGFLGHVMVTNLHQYIQAGPPTLLVNLDSRISPTRSDIPFGFVVLIGDIPAFVIKLGYGTAYVGLDGQLLADPRNYDNLVAFDRWRLIIPAFEEAHYVVYDSTTPRE